MRSIVSFTKRRKIGSALDKKLKIMIAEGTLKQHQFAETQELMYIQSLEVSNLEKQHQTQTADTLGKASNMNEKDLKLVKSRLEKESEAVISSLKMKHTHKLKVLHQTHLEQIQKFRENQAGLLTIIKTRLGAPPFLKRSVLSVLTLTLQPELKATPLFKLTLFRRRVELSCPRRKKGKSVLWSNRQNCT